MKTIKGLIMAIFAIAILFNSGCAFLGGAVVGGGTVYYLEEKKVKRIKGEHEKAIQLSQEEINRLEAGTGHLESLVEYERGQTAKITDKLIGSLEKQIAGQNQRIAETRDQVNRVSQVQSKMQLIQSRPPPAPPKPKKTWITQDRDGNVVVVEVQDGDTVFFNKNIEEKNRPPTRSDLLREIAELTTKVREMQWRIKYCESKILSSYAIGSLNGYSQDKNVALATLEVLREELLSKQIELNKL